jgi:lipopolysaccharide export system protein LptA
MSMFRRLRDYALALAVIVAAYGVYALTVVQWLEPHSAERTGIADDPPPPPPDLPNPFEHLFQPGDWELNSPKVLLTSQGTLLFLDYQPLDSGRLEIRPCTLILYSQDDETQQSGRPIVMRAAEGAILEFDDDVDLTRGQFGRLVGGRILGDIRLFSPESLPGAGDGLELTTRNLQIERLKAWTPHEVKFRYGQSYGSGHNLEMTLAPAEQIAGKGKTPAVGAVENVQLTQLDELVMQSQASSLLPSGDPLPASKQPQPPVRITCDGPMNFDAVRRVTTFAENVLVQRLMPGGPTDRLRCEQLAVYLADNRDVAKTKPAASASLSSGNVERIVALGKPAVLEAPSQNAYTEAERLEYNLKTRQVHLKSVKDGARILLRRGSDEFRAPELAYEIAEEHQLGKLWAPGPGKLTSVTGVAPEQRKLAAEWQKEIRIRQDDENQLISLLGGAKIDAESQGSFQAEEIHLWALEIPTASGGRESPGASLIPDRLLATGRVHADSPQLSADAQRLEAWFQQMPGDIPASQPKSPDDLSLTPADGTAQRDVREPVLRIREPFPTRPEKVQHFHVVGELVRMQVQQRGKLSSVEQITVEGKNVRINETNAEANEQPLWVAGTRVDLENGTGANCQITVTGQGEQPAILAARGLKLRSQKLLLSRRDNRVTIDQAGDMTLPINQDAAGRQLSEPRELSIAWQGSMLFDGSAAHFRKQVVACGDTYSGAADELHAQLTSPIDFSPGAKSQKKPEIKKLTMIGGAEFENRSFKLDDGRLQTVERMNAQSLEVDRITGAIFGAGPGWLSRVQVGQASSPASPMNPVTKPTKDDLTYLRVGFREQLTGNLHRRQVEFADQVEAVMGPVTNWDDVVNPRSRDDLGERGMVLTSDKLSVADFLQPGAKKGSLEMIATGNTRVEGRDYTAFSHRLTYAAAKSQLILEGDGRNDAQIKRKSEASIDAQKILYWTDSGAVQFDGGKSINIGPAAARPQPPRSPRDAVQPR